MKSIVVPLSEWGKIVEGRDKIHLTVWFPFDIETEVVHVLVLESQRIVGYFKIAGVENLDTKLLPYHGKKITQFSFDAIIGDVTVFPISKQFEMEDKFGEFKLSKL
jgi:hypothetical protein